MNKHQMMMQIRKKKLGLLIADARLAVNREYEECAHIMGVTIKEFNQFETGEAAPSLPQLETLACYLNIPMDHFWGNSSKSSKVVLGVETLQQRLQIQSEKIAEKLHLKRENSGMTLEALEEQTGISVEQLQNFETGEVPLPLPELEILTSILEIDLQALYDQEGTIGEWHQQQNTKEIYEILPEDLLKFVIQPVNQPYIQLAIKLSEMPAEKMRTIAESLLEITY